MIALFYSCQSVPSTSEDLKDMTVEEIMAIDTTANDTVMACECGDMLKTENHLEPGYIKLLDDPNHHDEVSRRIRADVPMDTSVLRICKELLNKYHPFKRGNKRSWYHKYFEHRNEETL